MGKGGWELAQKWRQLEIQVTVFTSLEKRSQWAIDAGETYFKELAHIICGDWLV